MSVLKDLMLGPPRLTLSAAESMTCGRVQANIGAISGASNFFVGGMTAYTLAQKVEHLGVRRAAARRVNGVSASVAVEMARGACNLFGSDLALATTGYAEPAADEGIDNPFAWWALAHRRRVVDRAKDAWLAVRSGRVECPGAPRQDAQQFVADAAVAELVAYLRELRG